MIVENQGTTYRLCDRTRGDEIMVWYDVIGDEGWLYRLNHAPAQPVPINLCEGNIARVAFELLRRYQDAHAPCDAEELTLP